MLPGVQFASPSKWRHSLC